MTLSATGDVGIGGERAALHSVDYKTKFKTFSGVENKSTLDSIV
jgi:hypothetical protein